MDLYFFFMNAIVGEIDWKKRIILSYHYNQKEANDEQKTLGDYEVPVEYQNFSGIQWPAVQANNFKIKSAFIQMV